MANAHTGGTAPPARMSGEHDTRCISCFPSGFECASFGKLPLDSRDKRSTERLQAPGGCFRSLKHAIRGSFGNRPALQGDVLALAGIAPLHQHGICSTVQHHQLLGTICHETHVARDTDYIVLF